MNLRLAGALWRLVSTWTRSPSCSIAEPRGMMTCGPRKIIAISESAGGPSADRRSRVRPMTGLPASRLIPISCTAPPANSWTSDTPGSRITRMMLSASSVSGWMIRSTWTPDLASTSCHWCTSCVRSLSTLIRAFDSTCAIWQQSRLTSSWSVTAITISADAIPASRSTSTRAALPVTMRASNWASSSAQRSGLGSTMVTALPSRMRRRAMSAPTCPPPAMSTFIGILPQASVGGGLSLGLPRGANAGPLSRASDPRELRGIPMLTGPLFEARDATTPRGLPSTCSGQGSLRAPSGVEVEAFLP